MKLYYSPGACSLASQIILREADLKFDLIKVDLKTKQFDGGDYKQITQKGYVPALQMENGELLTESSVILQWVADQVPHKNLIPKFGTQERYHAMEWLNFIATELHKGFSHLFYPHLLNEEALKSTHDKLQLRLEILNKQLQKNVTVLGGDFSVVDAYAYNILRWARLLKVNLADHKAILDFMERVSKRHTVLVSVEAEGLRL